MMLPDVAHEPYRTHLDILNGVFGKTLQQHASGTSPLTPGTIVWFPHVYRDGVNAERPSKFQNFLKEGGDTLVEVWPEDKVADIRTRGGQRDALVFAHFMGEQGYCFQGLYHPDHVKDGAWIWKRIASTVSVEDYV